VGTVYLSTRKIPVGAEVQVIVDRTLWKHRAARRRRRTGLSGNVTRNNARSQRADCVLEALLHG
jgi:hypothetical protein